MYLMPIYLDFSKAFDIVNHGILCLTLPHYGIRGLALNWFRYYLANRKQYVSMHNCDSSLVTMSREITQSSTLGPLLFLLYINDMSQSAPDQKFVYFADDTTIVSTSTNENNLFDNANNGLPSINTWLCVNRLSLNIKKTNT